MRFQELNLAGAFLIELEPVVDERGFFARCFAEEEFAARGLATRFPHCNLSRNRYLKTLRGMHYASAPSVEVKVVRCVAGAIYDVIVDLRPGSPTRGKWTAIELSAERGEALYIPPGFAHGFMTLADGTDVYYQMGDTFRPEAARGFRWDDPAFAIGWPDTPRVISARDASFANFDFEAGA